MNVVCIEVFAPIFQHCVARWQIFLTGIHFLKDLLKTPNRNKTTSNGLFFAVSSKENIVEVRLPHRREDENCHINKLTHLTFQPRCQICDELDQSGASSGHVTCQLLQESAYRRVVKKQTPADRDKSLAPRYWPSRRHSNCHKSTRSCYQYKIVNNIDL